MVFRVPIILISTYEIYEPFSLVLIFTFSNDLQNLFNFSLIYQCLNSLSYSYIAGVRSGKFSSCKVVPPFSLEIHLLCIIALLKFRFNNERSVCE